MTVGERIYQRRTELKMTMEELAAKIGKKPPVIWKYENDTVDMPSSVIKALHNILGLSYIELLDDDDSEDSALLAAYHRAGDETKAAVRAVLHVPEKEKEPAATAG